MLALESTLHDHYRITYVVDQRPDCVIYRAIDLRSSMRVLVAELPQPGEAAAADVGSLAGQIASVTTPGLLTLRDHFAEGTTYFLVSDDPGGQDLDRVARDRGGPLPEADVLTLVDRLLGAMDVLHDRNPPLLLGDLRSSDLWSSPDGGLSLAPFALARHVGGDASAYRAPELHDSQAEPTTSSDLYAIGAVLYQLLTGWAPPTAAQREAGTPLNAPRTLNGRVSVLAEQLALRALEKKPANRYQRAREMRSALETVRLMAGRPLGAMAPIEGLAPPAEATPPPAAAAPSPAARPGDPGAVYGPPPPAPPYAQPAPGTFAPQPQYSGGYTQVPPTTPPPPARSPRISNGCLIGIAVSLALIALVVCLVGAFIVYRIYTGPGIGLLGGGAAALSTPAPAGGAAQATTPAANQAAPTPGSALAATEIFTKTRQIKEDAIGPAVYAPDGKILAVGVGKTIQLRQGESLDQGPALAGHKGDVSALAFSPDGKILASGAQDENTVILWDLAGAKELRRLEGHTGWIRSLAFSPDGRTLASGSTDNTVRLWDVAGGKPIATLVGHKGFLGNVAFSPDGASLASASRDGTVILWDVAAHKPRDGFSYTAPNDPTTGKPFWLTGVAFSPDGATLAVGSVSASVYELDAATGKQRRELKGHEGWVVIRGVSYSPDGKTLASASLDGTVRLWSPLTGTERGVLSQRGLRLLGLSWSPDSQRLAASSDTAGSVVVWNAQSREVAQTVLLAQGAVTTLDYSQGGKVLGTGGASGTVRLHIFPDDRQVNLNGGAPTNQYIGFVSDTQLAAISDSGEVVIIDLTGKDRNRQLQGLQGFALNLAVSRDSRLVAAGNERGDVVIWEVSSQKLLTTLRGLRGPVFALAFNRDGSQIAAASNKDANAPQIVVWNTQSGDVKANINDQKAQITSLEMPAGGDTVASAASDGSLMVWSVGDGKVLSSIKAPAADLWFSSFAFSPDGKLLVTGSLTGVLSFWDPQSGAQLDSVSLGSGTVLSLAFRPDGKQIAVSTRDGGIFLFEPVS